MTFRSNRSKRALPNLTENKEKANKRKLVEKTPEPDPSAKRARGSQTPQPSTPSRRTHEHNAQRLVKLDSPPPSINYDKFINQDALKLFAEAKGEKQFQTASTIFWAANSVYIRHVPDFPLREMWNCHIWPLTTREERVKLEEAVFFELFKREHDAMSTEFIDHIEAFAENFVDSPAGKAYVSEAQRLKKSHRSPSVLDETHLESYMGYNGIRFGLGEVFEFFQGLRACAETTRMEDPHCATWLQCDVKAVQSDDANSWFKRLRAVALQLILQVVKNRLGFTVKGGASFPISRAQLKMLLERVLTPGANDPNVPSPPLPIVEQDMASWTEQFEDYHTATPTAVERTIDEGRDRMHEILDGRPLPEKVVIDLIGKATSDCKDLKTAMEDAIVQDLYTDGHPSIVSNYQTAKLYAQELSLTDLAYFNGSLGVKISICLEQVSDAKKRWRILQGMVAERVKYWDQMVSNLEAEENTMARFEAASEEMAALLNERAGRLSQRVGQLDVLHGSNKYTCRMETELRQPLDTAITSKTARSFAESTPASSPHVDSSFSSFTSRLLPGAIISSKLSDDTERFLHKDDELDDAFPGSSGSPTGLHIDKDDGNSIPRQDLD